MDIILQLGYLRLAKNLLTMSCKECQSLLQIYQIYQEKIQALLGEIMVKLSFAIQMRKWLKLVMNTHLNI